ncbi:MAG TPA: polysaccharide deacetylase family protein [Vicinamibacterales bacterium]|nr:polysaccharide deacetylase family protein [Vicinamibacterales bacterium]
MLSDHVLRLAWSLPRALPATQRAQPVTLMYHGIAAGPAGTMSAAVFEQHIRFLKQHFDFAGPDLPSTSGAGRQQVLLTFDDGLRNNAEVAAPILRRHGVPAVFFVCSRHAAPDAYLWFSYLSALENNVRWKSFSFRGDLYDMTPGVRRQSIERLRRVLLSLKPHPSAMYQAIEQELPPLEDFVTRRERRDLYEGMTAEQVGELAADPLFAIGVHTADHPFLSLCDAAEVRRQLETNRTWIENATGRPCRFVAYPAGDYNATVTDICSDMGFAKGFGVDTGGRSRSPLALARIGIYAPSTDILGFKVQWGHLLRRARIPIG